MVTLSVEVADADRKRLEAIIGPGHQVDRILGIVSEAGAQEAVDFATGQQVPATMTELRVYRVYRLLMAGMTIDEAEQLISVLFKVSPSTARRLAGQTVARYPIELAHRVHESVSAAIERATWDDAAGRWSLELPPGLLRERILALCDVSTVPDPSKRYGAVWHFPDETYAWLRSQVNLPERRPPGGRN